MTVCTPGLTVKQRALIARIKRDFGGQVHCEVDGGGIAWVVFINNARHKSSGYIHGLIGPGGEKILTIKRNGVDEPMNVLPTI